MADPFTAMAIGATVAGGGIKAFGDISAGQAQSRMYQYQAGVNTALAGIAMQNANWDIVSGEVKAQQAGLQARATAGRETVRGGAGNVALGPGSSTSKVVSSALSIGGENEAAARANAAHAAYGEQVQSAERTAEAGADVVAAQTSGTAADISAVGDIVSAVGSAGSVASKWYQMTGSGSPLDLQLDPNTPEHGYTAIGYS